MATNTLDVGEPKILDTSSFHENDKEILDTSSFHEDDKDSTQTALRSNYAHLTPGEAKRKFWRQYLMAITLCVTGGAYMGFAIFAPGNIIANPGFIEVMGTVYNPHTGAKEIDAVVISLWSGCNIVGQMLGMLVAPLCGDIFGRKAALWVMTLIMIVSIVLEIVANDWKVFLASKTIAGASTGLTMVAVTTFCSEISMPQLRGTAMGAMALGSSLGQVTCAIGLEVLQRTKPLAFRRIFYSEFVMVGLWLIPLLVLPESPMWLASKGKHERGKQTLKFLAGHQDDYDLEHEYAVVVGWMAASKTTMRDNKDNQWRAMFTGTNLKRTAIACILPTLVYFIGVPLIFGQTAFFFQIAGLKDPYKGNLIINIITMVCVIIGNWGLHDRIQQRTSLICGASACTVFGVVIGIMGCFPVTPRLAQGLITVCSLWVASYSALYVPVYWATLGGIATPSLRQKTNTFALAFAAALGCMWTYVLPILLSPQKAGLGTKTAFVFAGVTVPFLPMIYFFVPETKGRSSAAIDELFERGVPPRKFAQTLTSSESSQIADGDV